MQSFVKQIKWIFILVLVTALILFYTGSGRETIKEIFFVGKWKSSKLATPIYLYANGEWEIKKDDGAVLQYGVWQYKDKRIIWSYKVGSHMGHDGNPVLSATTYEFKVRESDGTTTTFKKLD